MRIRWVEYDPSTTGDIECKKAGGYALNADMLGAGTPYTLCEYTTNSGSD
jgi:hypothetical protein